MEVYIQNKTYVCFIDILHAANTLNKKYADDHD